MNWYFLLSQDEHDLYQYHIESYLKNAPVFVWLNLLGYMVCTLLFYNNLTPLQHLVFGACVFFGSIALSIYVKRSAKNLMIATVSQGIFRLTCVTAMGVIWWNAYFYVLVQTADEMALQQFIIIMAMISTIMIAMVGRFKRLVVMAVVFTILFTTLVLLTKSGFSYHQVLIQAYIFSLSQLIFLRTLNTQLSDLFRVKDQNIELVDALKQKNTALEQANLSQSRYLSAASHDLRQPLHALALLTTDAQRKNEREDVALTLEKIEQAIDSLSQSFNAMLNLSRLDAGVVKPDFQALPLQRVFERIRVEFEEIAAQKNLSLHIVSSKLWVHTDEAMLHSILSNFVSNAIRYTEQGRVMIGVRRASHGNLKVLVYDTGTGVPADKARQIFQEYQRLEYAQQRVKGGVGLGLAISERMAKLLGIQLLVQSVPDKGSCFGLKIMRVPTQQTNIHAPQKKRESVKDPLTGKRIAILDDDETAIEHLEELLSSWGLDVSVVLSADMLRESMDEDGVYDVVLSDYHLGLEGQNGLDALKVARDYSVEGVQPLCILATGDTSAELTQSVRAEGFEIMYKPLRPVRLRAFLNTALAGKQEANLAVNGELDSSLQ